jgi:hypothetical protein
MNPAAAGGALLLLFDVAPEAVDEHDEWHTHEHMPERLALPGFLRGTRWTRAGGGPRYGVVYEVERPADLASAAYRERLDHPTPWTTKMMPQYRGMRRTLCEVRAGAGEGIGSSGLVVTFAAQPGREAELQARLQGEILPPLAGRRGLASWRWLASALPAEMTREQAIRGRDDGVHAALWVTGYDAGVVAALSTGELAPPRLVRCGAAAVEPALFALALVMPPCGAAVPGPPLPGAREGSP